MTMVLISLFDICPEFQEAVDRIDSDVWGKAVDDAYEEVGDAAERAIQKRLRKGVVSRQLFLNALAWLLLVLIYSGYALYLAQMYSTTGGHW